jgi:hypothetical protein
MAKKSKNKQPYYREKILAQFDEVNVQLKTKFAVKNINYITDNGVIRYGWAITNELAIDEAVHLLQVQEAPIYILGPYAGAVIKWNVIKVNLIGYLYKEGKQIDEFRTDKFEEVKSKINEWYKVVVKGEKHDL